jgi:hypothetical protein
LRVRPIADLTRVLHFASEFTKLLRNRNTDRRGGLCLGSGGASREPS